jgi:hypothetical protein
MAAGRLSEDVAAGGPRQAPESQYIAESATLSEDAWAREEALYRAKNEDEANPRRNRRL